LKTCAIIIPTYKSEKYIKQCILSIQNQAIPEGWEIDIRIGVDGCEQTAREIKIPYYFSAENVGAYVMRNSLISLSPADCYMLFDSDDVMLSNYISETLKKIDIGHDVIMTAKINCDEYLRPLQSSKVEYGGAITFTQKVIDKIGGFYSARCAADSDYLDRIKLYGFNIYEIRIPLYLRRKHSESLTRKPDTGMGSEYRRKVWLEMTEKRKSGNIFITPEIMPLEKITPPDPDVAPVYILIRTSGRPAFFFNTMESVRVQTYKNIITIVHSDEPDDTYVYGDIVIHGDKITEGGNAPYNEYCNTLLQNIPDGEGWYFFLDDDDVLHNENVIDRLVRFSQPDCINVAHVMRWNFEVFPKKWRECFSFQTECFFLHTDHKLKATWWRNKGGDHYYSKQLTGILTINWIDNLITCRTQDGKGNGKRKDMGGRLQAERPGNISIQNVVIQYIKEIRTPYCIRGKVGEMKTMPRNRAERLESKGKVKIVTEVFSEPQAAI